jgi:hypothetical protein
MKKLSSLSIIFLFLIALIWYYRGFHQGLSKYINEQNIELHYVIVYKDKAPGHPNPYYVFKDGRKWEPTDTAFNHLLTIGDSVAKESGSFKYVIYKTGGVDSTVYVSPQKNKK